jgi:hypothetical protein
MQFVSSLLKPAWSLIVFADTRSVTGITESTKSAERIKSTRIVLAPGKQKKSVAKATVSYPTEKSESDYARCVRKRNHIAL